MKTIDIHDAKFPLSEYVNQVKTEPMIITVDGKPFAALMDVEDVDLETLSLSRNAEFIDIIQQSRKRQEKEGGISSEEIRRRLEYAHLDPPRRTE